jgi:glycosyltransferase involved in cell wall biosynthesis
MDTSRPEVTTIIPSRDRAHWLPRTLLSALAQENVETEVIVIDDGSRTPVTTVLRLEELPRLRVIRHPTPTGPPSARNTGVEQARGRWVAVLDDDDLWAPAKLRRELDVAEAAGAGFAFCGAIAVDEQGVPIRVEHPPEANEQLHQALLAANVVPFPNSSLLVKTDLLRSLGGFDPALTHLCDWDLLVRLSVEDRGAMTRETLVAYTIHQANLHQDESLLEEELRRFDRKHAAARDASGVRLDRAAWLWWRLGARRSAGRRLASTATYLQLAWNRRDPGLALRGATVAILGERAMRSARGMLDRARPRQAMPAPPWLPQAATPSEAALQAVVK